MAFDEMQWAQWTPEEQVKMAAHPKAPFQFNRVQPQLYTDVSGGYTFTQHAWKKATTELGWRERLMKDALAHRAEAIRRRVVCRLSDRKIEADHWLAMQRFLENLFKLPEAADASSSTS